MSEAAENLNYDFNYNMFLAKIMLSNLNRAEGDNQTLTTLSDMMEFFLFQRDKKQLNGWKN